MIAFTAHCLTSKTSIKQLRKTAFDIQYERHKCDVTHVQASPFSEHQQSLENPWQHIQPEDHSLTICHMKHV
jgi:hypothetical protein